MKTLSASLRQAAPAPADPPATPPANHRNRTGPDSTVWIGLHFPRLVLEAGDPPEGLPFVLVEECGGNRVIHAACDIARNEGVTPGMPLNAAYTLCRNLVVRLRDPKEEERTLRQAAWQASRFTPAVSLAPPDTLLLDVSQCFRLHGGPDRLRQQIARAFTGEIVISVAPTPAAAGLLAGNGLARSVARRDELRSALGELNLSQCDLDTGLVRELGKCGLVTLRDLWRLPRTDLARRFGPDLIAFLDRLCGDRPDPRPVHVPGVRFREQLELPTQTENSAVLEAGAARLLERAREFLRRRQAMAETARLELHHIRQRDRDRECTTLTVRLQQPDREPRRFLAQLTELLDRTPLPAPVDRLGLCIDRVIPWQGQHRDLFQPRPGDSQAWPELLEGLIARLGASHVYAVGEVPDHRPERAWHIRTPEVTAEPTVSHWNDAGPRPVRPLWLLPEPRPLSRPPSLPAANDNVERIEAGWWDGRDCRRDYHRLITARGIRCWVFHDLDPDPPRWRIHGLFA